LDAGNDFASLPVQEGRVIVSTDSHIVKPLFFPGGDIGRLAVCGTVNDVAMSGAIPRFLTAGFIIEEGFAISNLEKIAQSMQSAACEAEVTIVAGDTKGRGKKQSRWNIHQYHWNRLARPLPKNQRLWCHARRRRNHFRFIG